MRLTFVKVAEVQHRGATHFHGVLRADVATKDGTTAPAAALVHRRADARRLRRRRRHRSWVDPHTSTALDALAASDSSTRTGLAAAPAPMKLPGGATQNLAKILRVDGEELSPRAVAGYIAKYATKATDSIGHLDARIRTAEALELPRAARRVRPHLLRIVANRLGPRRPPRVPRT